MSTILKTGIIKSGELNEFNITNTLDRTCYIEPDGSVWARIIHHNNPASYLFYNNTTYGSFTNDKVYIDSNRWYNANLCKQMNNSWELMIKQKPTSDGTEAKYRWIQYVSPLELSMFDETTAAKVTKNTSSGYSNHSSYGGLYNASGYSSNSPLVANNGNSGNWFGAFGCWTAYQSGIPGYAGAVITTGYMDLYIRIDNTFGVGNEFIKAREFIEF